MDDNDDGDDVTGDVSHVAADSLTEPGPDVCSGIYSPPAAVTKIKFICLQVTDH